MFSAVLSLSISNSVLLVAASTFFAYIFIRILYNLFWSPLSAIPGPWYAAVSDFWLTAHVLRLEQCKTIQHLFEVYGPVVRVGPNKVVFRDVTTMRSVYSVHKFDKSPYYKSLLTNDNDHAMTTLEHARHAVRRKGYAPHYTFTNLAKFQPEFHEATFSLVNALENIGGKDPLECLTLFRHLMVDVVTSVSYGFQANAIKNWAMGLENPLSTAINDFPKRGILRSAVPTWAWKLVCWIPNSRLRQLCASDNIMAEFVSARVYEMRSQMNAGKLGDSDKIPLLQRLLQYQYSADKPMPDHDTISECMGHLIAGADTTSTTLAYLFWELSRRADIAKKLQTELEEAMPNSRHLPDISEIQELPYLNAFIKEGLRLYSAAPSLLERVVPSTTKNGLSNENFDLLGYGLPPGTVVSTQAWSMHRDADVFPSADTFMPERWLQPFSTPEELTRMSQYMMPFGTGTRVCGGQNLAQVMLKIAVAALARNFDVIAPPETNERSMEIKDSFVIFPAAMQCKLSFIPRQE
ncbi:hypothetical protein M378DRAFT_169922 [Amanita muscaria Koide BX008]|uniref:Cytochrome P450 n=1 Tax=Amanita muscaria (strain Koide BX008) TaxID=946122 RepID=A0A0C2S854_AMAMK|nr:hypothetical protein M378DRAFT_169922 [Amanita muscaria Koide BX008]